MGARQRRFLAALAALLLVRWQPVAAGDAAPAPQPAPAPAAPAAPAARKAFLARLPAEAQAAALPQLPQLPLPSEAAGLPTAPPGAVVPQVADVNPTGEWVWGTWTTGYWDCCKPSCSWPGKGNVTRPVQACDAESGKPLEDPLEPSVCLGGRASTCSSNVPFNVSRGVSMGFAAAAVTGGHGLTGDDNCGQCFELIFTNHMHRTNGWTWGGAAPELVGKRMIVQVTNIGYDVVGDHSFDVMIPGAGQGAFSAGCSVQHRGFSTGDFDCDNRYGGCPDRGGCDRLPPPLQDACRWRYDWYHWLSKDGRTNNPFVVYRRVRCPSQLTDISGSVPVDDEDYQVVTDDADMSNADVLV